MKLAELNVLFCFRTQHFTDIEREGSVWIALEVQLGINHDSRDNVIGASPP